MTSDWVNAIKDDAVELVITVDPIEISCHDSEPDLGNPTASEIAGLDRAEIAAAEWAAISTDDIYRQAQNNTELDFGTATGSTTITWIVLWDGTDGDGAGDGDGALSALPIGKLALVEPKPISSGDPVTIPIGNLTIRAGGIAS